MATIGFATLDVIPSLRGLQGELDRQTGGPMREAGQRAGTEFGDSAAESAGDSFKERLKEGVKGLAAPLAGIFAGAQIFDFFKQGIDDASGLNEAATKIGAIFGDATGEVQAFASTAAESLGQTQLQALDAAAVFGTFGKAAGLAGTDLSEFSTELLTLATDLASFYNTDVDTAIEALGSGLRGEAEPLRQFGILLDDASLRSEALRQGLIKTTKDALTPQQKVLASQALILSQTADAQGDFERTSGGLANQQRILTAQFAELRTEVGAKLLPALTSLVQYGNENIVPMLKDAGDFAVSGVKAFTGLPEPVKNAALAFVALRVAALTGLTALAGGAVAAISSAFITLRLRVMFAGDAFALARAKVGLFAASLAGLRAGAAGASAAIGGLLRAALPIAALTAGITLFTKFSQQQEESKRRVDDLTESLDKQTGALTRATRETVFNALSGDGGNSGFSSIEAAKDLGISLDVLTDAALGNAEAMKIVNEATADSEGSLARRYAIDKLNESLNQQGSDLDNARQKSADYREAMRVAAAEADNQAGSTDTLAAAFEGQATSTDKARLALRKLIVEEKSLYDARLQRRQDALALEEQIREARRSARDGAGEGLNIRTNIGGENRGALYDLAEQFNNADPKVRNAEGAYVRIREEFVRLADQMGATEGQGAKLADQLLRVPKTAPLKFQSEGFRERIEEIRKIREAIRQLRQDAINRINLGPASDIGGIPYGRGGTSPNGSGGPPRRGRGAAGGNPKIDLSSGGGLNRSGGGQTIYQYNGNVTYTDDEQGRRRAKKMEQRANGDGVRR